MRATYLILILLVSVVSAIATLSTDVKLAKYAQTNFNHKLSVISKDCSDCTAVVAAVSPIKRPADTHIVTHSLSNLISKHWFIITEICLIAISYVNPSIFKSNGVFHPEIFVKKLGVFLIFVINGMAISANELVTSTANWKVSSLIQSYSLLLIPLFIWSISGLIANDGIKYGLQCVSCLPCTINMCITLTSAAKGDVSSKLHICIQITAYIYNCIHISKYIHTY